MKRLLKWLSRGIVAGVLVVLWLALQNDISWNRAVIVEILFFTAFMAVMLFDS